MEISPLKDKRIASSDQALEREAVPAQNRVHPKKLLLSKWTAVSPMHKEKHFLVTKVIEPDVLGQAIVDVELEAAMTGRIIDMAWRELKDATRWRQGWV